VTGIRPADEQQYRMRVGDRQALEEGWNPCAARQPPGRCEPASFSKRSKFLMKFALRHAKVAPEREGMLLPWAARAMGETTGPPLP
jgi:hypothetical protein